MVRGSARFRLRAILAVLGGRRAQPSGGSVCRVTLDLRGVPWGADTATVEELLLSRPGVLGVEVDARRRRAVILHDGRASLPQIWNWLQAQARTGDTPESGA